MPGCEMSDFFFENILSPNRKWISKMTEEKKLKVQIQKLMNGIQKIKNSKMNLKLRLAEIFANLS